MRIGHGYDVHRLVEGRDLILGGVKIDYEKGLDGHSDADVLLHAVSDALLGAAGLGDIGRHFPDTDPKYKGADSLVLLQVVAQRVQEAFSPKEIIINHVGMSCGASIGPGLCAVFYQGKQISEDMEQEQALMNSIIAKQKG